MSYIKESAVKTARCNTCFAFFAHLLACKQALAAQFVGNLENKVIWNSTCSYAVRRISSPGEDWGEQLAKMVPN